MRDSLFCLLKKRAKKYKKRATLPYMVITKYGNV